MMKRTFNTPAAAIAARHARNRKLGIIIGVPLLTLLFALFSYGGAQRIEDSSPDREDGNLQLWVQTRDSAPGDAIAFRLRLTRDVPGRLRTVRATIDGHEAPLVEDPHDLDDDSVPDDHDERFVTMLPETTSAVVTIKLVAEITTSDGDLVPETIEANVPVVSASARTFKHLLHRAAAALAWLLMAALAYASTRWLGNANEPRALEPAGARPKAGFLDRVLARLLVLAVMAFGVAGELVFVRPILRTTTLQAPAYVYALHVLWLLGLAVAVVSGVRARARDYRWAPLRLRAVIGTQQQGSYREPASTLPAMLSRDAPARTYEEIAEALRAAGYSIEARRRVLVASMGGSPALKIRRPRAPRERPEGLSISAHETADAQGAMRALAALFGPVECKLRGKPPALVEPV